MTVTLQAFAYTVPYKQPIQVGRLEYVARQGLACQITVDQGKPVLCDIAPLPGVHHETLDDCIALLPRVYQAIISKYKYDYSGLPPSVLFAIDQIRLQQVEGLVPASNLSIRSAELLDLRTGGDTRLDRADVVKVKPSDIEDPRLSAILQAQPDLRLRLDFNQSLSTSCAAETLARIDALFGQQVDFVEEPCPPPFPPAALPLAADESIWDKTPDDLTWPNARVVVIKPTRIGAVASIKRIIRHSLQEDRRVILSSAFDSDLTHGFYQHLIIEHGLMDEFHGLGTTKHLAAQAFTWSESGQSWRINHEVVEGAVCELR